MSTKNKPEILLVTAVVAIGLVLRLAYINHGLPDFENPDEIDFIGPALNLTFNLPQALWSGNFSDLNIDYFYGHPQGYTNLLFAFLTVFKEVWQMGGNFGNFTKSDLFVFSRVVTGLLSCLVPLVMYLLGRRFFSKTVAWLSLVLGAVSFYFILYSHTASPYTVSTLTNLIFIYFLLAFWDFTTRKNLTFVGLSLGLAAAFNFGSVALLVPLLIVMGDLVRKKKMPIKKAMWAMVEIGIIGTIVFLILSPATLINFSATLSALRDLSFTQKMGCLGQTTEFGPWYYFFGRSLPSGTLTILNPASFNEALGLLPTLVLGLSLLISLFNKNGRVRLLGLTFLGALVLYSTSSNQALRWLLPFLPLLLIVGAVEVEEISKVVKSIILLTLVAVLLGPSLINNWTYLRALSVPDSREATLSWILTSIPKETGIARPTISAPPIWRYGYKYDRSISHPQCNKPDQPLNKAAPSSLESYICDPVKPQGQVKYIVVSSSVVSTLLDASTAKKYPNLYNGWRGLYDQVYNFSKAKEVGSTGLRPMTGPTISIYKVPEDFSCQRFTEEYWRNNKL